MRLQLNNFTQKLNLLFCGLGEERTKFRKKKKEKKTLRCQKWVGWDERVS